MDTCKQCRNILTVYVTGVALVMSAGAAVVAYMAHDKAAPYQDQTAVVVNVASPVKAHNYHWQERVDDLSEACGNALDQVAAAMSEEEYDSVPLEVWRSAYQQCLFDAEVTI